MIAQRQSETAQKQSALSDKQLEFTNLQSRIAEAQAMPSFEIKIAQQMNPATGRADNNWLTIDNNGGPVREFYASAVYFVEITAGEYKVPVPKPTFLRFAINDYYAASAVTAATKGNLTTFVGNDNNLKVFTFERALSAAAKPNGWMYANTEERTFLRLQYRDILNRSHSEYYQVVPVSGSPSFPMQTGVHSLRRQRRRGESICKT